MNGLYLSMPAAVSQIEIDARVNAALAEMPVERAAVAVLFEELSQIAQIAAELVGRNGGILPAFPRDRLAGHARGRAEPRLAHLPHELFLARDRRTASSTGRSACCSSAAIARARVRVALLVRLAAELDEQPAAAVGQQLAGPAGCRFIFFMSSISRSSMPSRPIGWNARISAT